MDLLIQALSRLWKSLQWPYVQINGKSWDSELGYLQKQFSRFTDGWQMPFKLSKPSICYWKGFRGKSSHYRRWGLWRISVEALGLPTPFTGFLQHIEPWNAWLWERGGRSLSKAFVYNWMCQSAFVQAWELNRTVSRKSLLCSWSDFQ